MAATGFDVCVYAPIHLDTNLFVCPAISAICRRQGPRQTCRKDNDLQVYVGPPNLICEFPTRQGFEDTEAMLATYLSYGVQEVMLWGHDQPFRWHQLRDGEYVDLAQEGADPMESRALPGLIIHKDMFKRWGDMIRALEKNVAGIDVAAILQTLTNDPGELNQVLIPAARATQPMGPRNARPPIALSADTCPHNS